MSEMVGDGATDTREARRIGALRIGVGLIQGLLLDGLNEALQHKAWPATDPVAYAAIGSFVFFTPLVLIAGLRAFRRGMLIAWTMGAGLIAAALAGYGAWHAIGEGALYALTGQGPFGFTVPVGLVTAAALFIANHLLEARELDRRWFAAYPSYFDPAWKHAVQGGLSVAFTVAFWLLLTLGGQLFALIKITALNDLLQKPWFYFPATTAAFAAAVHLTDVRAGLVKGVRMVALMLLSWLTPLLVLLAGAFLLALPFTGLAPLWGTRAAASILLTAASLLILLINAAFQDGVEAPPTVLRWAVRIAAVIMAPLVVLAWVGICLRVRQHGLTPERIMAFAWAVIGSVYALGYGFAALRPGPWMRPLERTNVIAAWVILVLVAVLFSPIADPARLSVADQVARLERGKVTVEAFDYGFLRFRSNRFGREALRALAARKGGGRDAVIASEAADALKQEYPWTPKLKPAALTARFHVYPKGAVLPEGFLKQDALAMPCLYGDKICDAYVVDLDGDGVPEVLVDQYQLEAYGAGPDGKWRAIGTFNRPLDCFDPTAALREGKTAVVPAKPRVDLQVDGHRLEFSPQLEQPNCVKNTTATPRFVAARVGD